MSYQITGKQTIEEVEKLAIQETLRLELGHYENTAKTLGIHRRTLYRKIKRHNIPHEVVWQKHANRHSQPRFKFPLTMEVQK